MSNAMVENDFMGCDEKLIDCKNIPTYLSRSIELFFFELPNVNP